MPLAASTTSAQHSAMTIGQIAKRWGVSRGRVQSLVDDGKLRGVFVIPSSGRYGETMKIPYEAVVEAEEGWAVHAQVRNGGQKRPPKKNKMAPAPSSSTFRNWMLRLNRLLVLMQTSRIEICIPASHLNIRVAHEFGQSNIANTPVGPRAVPVAFAVQDKLFVGFELYPRPFSSPIHVFHQPVLCVRLAPGIQKHIFRACWGSFSQATAHPPDAVRQRNYARFRLFLHRDRLVLGNDPKSLLQIDHVPDQLANLARPAAGLSQSQQYPPKRSVSRTCTQQISELILVATRVRERACGLAKPTRGSW